MEFQKTDSFPVIRLEPDSQIQRRNVTNDVIMSTSSPPELPAAQNAVQQNFFELSPPILAGILTFLFIAAIIFAILSFRKKLRNFKANKDKLGAIQMSKLLQQQTLSYPGNFD